MCQLINLTSFPKQDECFNTLSSLLMCLSTPHPRCYHLGHNFCIAMDVLFPFLFICLFPFFKKCVFILAFLDNRFSKLLESFKSTYLFQHLSRFISLIEILLQKVFFKKDLYMATFEDLCASYLSLHLFICTLKINFTEGPMESD